MPSELSAVLKRVLISAVAMVVSTLVGLLLHHVVFAFLDEDQAGGGGGAGGGGPLGRLQAGAKGRELASCAVDPDQIEETLDHVGGLSQIKEEIRAHILLPLRHPAVFFGDAPELHPSRGFLFYGPPGTGKTMLARAIAKEANVPFLALGLAALEQKYYGESSKMVRAAFAHARRVQPCVLFFDEVDGLCRRRSDQDQACVYGLKTELLSALDGLSSGAGGRPAEAVVAIACTNCVASLDAALLRRLPRRFEVGLPSLDERADILRKRGLSKPLARLAASRTEGKSGSDLAELVRRANGFRLRDQCADAAFVARLETADSAADVADVLLPLEKAHVEEALAASASTSTTSKPERPEASLRVQTKELSTEANEEIASGEPISEGEAPPP